MLRVLSIGFGLILLSGCTLLRADAPLLIGADHGGFTAQEGLWVMRDPQTCRVNPKRADPAQKSCLDWMRIQEQGDGTLSVDSLPPDDKGPYLVRIARAGANAFVGEAVRGDEILYLALTPGKGAWNPPFRRLHVRVIACDDLVAQGEALPGVIIETDVKDGSIIGCKVENPEVVSEAAQASLAAHPETLSREPIVFVRP